MDEFALIKKYFLNIGTKESSQDKATSDEFDGNAGKVQLGIGDDCALLEIPNGSSMAVSTDTFIEGHHFFAGTDPVAVGYKSLAVNLSDLAAMGANPLAFTLALTLPKADEEFLRGFAKGLSQAASTYPIPLVGGDTTRGPLSITITVMGSVGVANAFKRSLAKVGDYICVSGPLGGAALAVKERYKALKAKAPRPEAEAGSPSYALDYPKPRFDVATALRDVGCHCALDISDGLRGDLQHILEASKVSAILDWDDIPKHPALVDNSNHGHSQNHNQSDNQSAESLTQKELQELVLAGGDDYELCFTLNPKSYECYKAKEVQNEAPQIYKIGEIVEVVDSSEPLFWGESIKEDFGEPLGKSNSSTMTNADASGGTSATSRLFLRQNGVLVDITGSGFSHF